MDEDNGFTAQSTALSPAAAGKSRDAEPCYCRMCYRLPGQPEDPRPWVIHRNKKGWPRWYQRWLEAWWIVTGKQSLHRAWQAGLDHGSAMEYCRTVIHGGR
jgi:hypothetical protein